jgi:hypothetical protein
LAFEEINLSDPGIEREAVSKSLIVSFNNADATLCESAQADEGVSTELPP